MDIVPPKQSIIFRLLLFFWTVAAFYQNAVESQPSYYGWKQNCGSLLNDQPANHHDDHVSPVVKDKERTTGRSFGWSVLARVRRKVCARWGRCLFGACTVLKEQNRTWGRCLYGACSVLIIQKKNNNQPIDWKQHSNSMVLKAIYFIL